MTPDAFIKEIATVYGPPKTESPARYLEIVRETVAAFQPAEIELAAGLLVEQWTYRRWPAPAELRKFLSDAGAKLAQQRPVSAQHWERGRVWKQAREWADGWFERQSDSWLVSTAEAEGWTEDLRQVVVTIAHSCLVPSAGGQPPRDDQIVMGDEAMEYYRRKRESYRLGSYRAPDPPPERYRGDEGIERDRLPPGARRVSERFRQVQSREGEAILAAMERSETHHDDLGR